MPSLVWGPPPRDLTLQHPRCVLQLLKKHFAPYTPEAVSGICGVPAGQIVRAAGTMLRNSGTARTCAVAYAVGWTQHTTGGQIIACSAALQLLLGNIGRPGGGIQQPLREQLPAEFEPWGNLTNSEEWARAPGSAGSSCRTCASTVATRPPARSFARSSTRCTCSRTSAMGAGIA